MTANPFPAQRRAALLEFEQATVEELRMLLHERNVGIKERGAEHTCEYGTMARAEILCLVVAIRAMRRITRGRPWPEGARPKFTPRERSLLEAAIDGGINAGIEHAIRVSKTLAHIELDGETRQNIVSKVLTEMEGATRAPAYVDPTDTEQQIRDVLARFDELGLEGGAGLRQMIKALDAERDKLRRPLFRIARPDQIELARAYVDRMKYADTVTQLAAGQVWIRVAPWLEDKYRDTIVEVKGDTVVFRGEGARDDNDLNETTVACWRAYHTTLTTEFPE